MVMYSEKTGYYRSLEEYRAAETELHTELMGITRRYISKLGIVSLTGILDIVKQEIRELEKATRKNLDDGPHKQTKVEVKDQDYF